MKEQSHKSEMGAAVRGDFERLRARRGEAADAPMQAPVEESPDLADEVAPRPDPAPIVAVVPPSPAPVEAEPAPAQPAAEEAPPRQSWLDRLLNRG